MRKTRTMVVGLGLLVSPLVTPLAPTAQAAARTHVIEQGDTLWEVARAHGCSVAALRRANALEPDSPVRPGQSLTIPSCDKLRSDDTSGTTTYEVRPGDTLSHIAHRFDTTVDDIRARNDLASATIVVGQTLIVAGEPKIPVRIVEGQSVGSPRRGKLVGGIQLPHDSAYYRRRPKWAYGAQHVVDHTRRVIASVHRRFPSLHRLAIGDISAPRGGSIPGHASHQSGRDVDLGLYFEKTPAGYPREFVRAKDGDLHVEATWALVHALWKASRKPGGPAKVFLDYRLQGVLYDHARKHGISKKVLRKLFQYPDGRWARGRLVMHEPKHDDHIHVRYACPPKDDTCR